MTTRTALLIAGGLIEIAGLTLVSLDFLAPGFRTGARTLAERRRRLLESVRAWVRARVAHMRGEYTLEARPGDIRVGGVPATTVVHSPSVEVSLEQRLSAVALRTEQLREHLEEETQQRIAGDELVSRRLEELQHAIEDAMRESESAYLPWRALGLVLAIVGATMVSVAGFWA